MQMVEQAFVRRDRLRNPELALAAAEEVCSAVHGFRQEVDDRIGSVYGALGHIMTLLPLLAFSSLPDLDARVKVRAGRRPGAAVNIPTPGRGPVLTAQVWCGGAHARPLWQPVCPGALHAASACTRRSMHGQVMQPVNGFALTRKSVCLHQRAPCLYFSLRPS